MVMGQSWLGLHNVAEAEKALPDSKGHFFVGILYIRVWAMLPQGRPERDAVAYFQKGWPFCLRPLRPSQLSQMMTDAVGRPGEWPVCS
jgi:hypothetical protein